MKSTCNTKEKRAGWHCYRLYVRKHKWSGFLCCATHVPTVDTLTRVACIYRWSCVIHMCSNPSYSLIINLCVCAFVCDVFIFPWLVSCCPLWPRLFLNCSLVANPCNDLSILQRWSTGPRRKEHKQLQQQWRVRWRPLTRLYSRLTDEFSMSVYRFYSCPQTFQFRQLNQCCVKSVVQMRVWFGAEQSVSRGLIAKRIVAIEGSVGCLWQRCVLFLS